MDQTQARAEATHREIKQSARTIESSAAAQEDSADRRTELAADRTVLAAERTYAAWVRTGLAALAAGVGSRALLQPVVAHWMTLATAALLVAFSAFCFVAAVWRELLQVRPTAEARRLPAAMLVAVNGFLVLVAITALVGVVTS